jgi:hypothetical protein
VSPSFSPSSTICPSYFAEIHRHQCIGNLIGTPARVTDLSTTSKQPLPM